MWSIRHPESSGTDVHYTKGSLSAGGGGGGGLQGTQTEGGPKGPKDRSAELDRNYV